VATDNAIEVELRRVAGGDRASTAEAVLRAVEVHPKDEPRERVGDFVCVDVLGLDHHKI